ncbi:hypothetical protein MA16_Dca028565 [Dendrobium catenatum]|uniref:Uncharacterized protein n=1 Tax=Dendrobium catenatum TaxID=906689 RepID=A0A2I0VAR2_9ASPA|nr:hypothetical protein MA16_Dca028565 [Dendrobium catenatum]
MLLLLQWRGVGSCCVYVAAGVEMELGFLLYVNPESGRGSCLGIQTDGVVNGRRDVGMELNFSSSRLREISWLLMSVSWDCEKREFLFSSWSFT